MFTFEIHKSGSGIESNPYGLNWATDPVDGDPYFNFDWEASGIAVNPFGNSDLGTLLEELRAMQNNAGAGDNIPQIIATLIEIAKKDGKDPAVQAFFQSYGKILMSQLIDAELLLVYSQNIRTGSDLKELPDPAKAEAAMVAFGHSLLGVIGGSSPLLAPMVSEINDDISQAGLNQLRSEFWVQDKTTSAWTFQIPGGKAGDPSQDGHPINLNGADGAEIFAEYVFGDVLYGGTFGDSKFANAANDLFLTMFMSVLSKSKDPIYLFMALMIMFGISKDDDYQDQMKGYGYTTNWLSKHQDQIQKLITEYNTPGFFADDKGNPNGTNAIDWMQGVRRLFIDAEFNPYAGSLQSNIYSTEQDIFNKKDSGGTILLGDEFFKALGGDTAATKLLAQMLGIFSQGKPDPKGDSQKDVPPDTEIVDNFQTLTKTFTDRSQSIQTEMSGVSSNDNTIVNTLKTALSSISDLVKSINQHMSN